MTRLHPRALAAAGIVSLGAVLLSGCSSSSPKSATAHAATAQPSSSASGAAQFTAYRNCLTQHGLTLPTGRPGGGTFSRNPSDRPSFSRNPSDRPSGGYKGGGGFGGFGGASADPSAQAAIKACASLAPKGGFGGGGGGFGGGGAGGGTALAAFTSCMKDHGVTVTPQQLRSITSSTDAKTVAALKVCKPLLPTPGAPGATPPATPSS